MDPFPIIASYIIEVPAHQVENILAFGAYGSASILPVL
jgi:hypothetical protein